MNSDFAHVFGDPRKKPNPTCGLCRGKGEYHSDLELGLVRCGCVPEDYDDPFQSPEYQTFVESLVPLCRCEYDRPCDGVLAGGLCDERKDEDDRHPDDNPLDEEDRNEC